MNRKRGLPDVGAAKRAAGHTHTGDAPRTVYRGAHSEVKGRPVYVQSAARLVCAGVLRGDVFVKSLRQEHILRTPPAIAVSSEVLAELRSAGCRAVECQVDDGRVLTAPLTAFFERGFELERGFGRQVALPLRFWAQHDAEQPRLLEVV